MVATKKSILTAGLLLGGAGTAQAQIWLPLFPVCFGTTSSVTAAPQTPVVVEGDGQTQVIDGTPKHALFVEGRWGSHRGLDAAPFGESVAGHIRTQVVNGSAARMTLYDFDFVCGDAQLNYRGVERLRQIACLLQQNEFPVVIQRVPLAPGLLEARRLAVLNELTAIAPLPAERVVVGMPLAIPLNGVEAERIYKNLETQTMDFGFPLYKSWYSGGIGSIGGGSRGGSGSSTGSSGSR